MKDAKVCPAVYRNGLTGDETHCQLPDGHEGSHQIGGAAPALPEVARPDAFTWATMASLADIAEMYVEVQSLKMELAAAKGGWAYINPENDLPKHGGQVLVSWGFTKDFKNGGPFVDQARWEKASRWTMGKTNANGIYIYAWKDLPKPAPTPPDNKGDGK